MSKAQVRELDRVRLEPARPVNAADDDEEEAEHGYDTESVPSDVEGSDVEYVVGELRSG